MKLHLTIAVAFLLCLQVNGQQLNVEITENTTTPYLLGRIDRSGLELDNYKTWFSKNYENYGINTALTNQFASDLKDYNITLFMGTWCGDSKREVPRFYKILEACNFPMDQLTAVALSRQLKPIFFIQSAMTNLDDISVRVQVFNMDFPTIASGQQVH